MADFMEVERWLQDLRSQRESVKGKDTPVRVEFRYRGGTKHWQYFVAVSDALGARDVSISYLGSKAIIEHPLSDQIQVRGPRGGWSRA